MDDRTTLEAIKLYVDKGFGFRSIGKMLGLPYSRIRAGIIRAGVSPRTIAEAISVSPARRKADAAKIGVKFGNRTPEQRKNIASGQRKYWDKNARGKTKKPNGYIEYTRGENKFRSEHRVTAENILGRKLLKNEVVHHIDGNKTNNSPNNLTVMTRAAHTTLHRRARNAQ